ncbi:ankyrin repeat domain-containing protein [Roseinatronobacter alkalisoli]|uniref:Ankyrin repeat domain-containing protein n=1 Tax=Roseinatronobacter alkalisoli TaxID=3028235 RepID=A0ABT5TDN3_9RHOB|nr:hypothetical protein [Roseinatronobacter sp. HJB301]MDD7973237.1 hypothetical protein [Roseinatronobacter sp. HJB301]
MNDRFGASHCGSQMAAWTNRALHADFATGTLHRPVPAHWGLFTADIATGSFSHMLRMRCCTAISRLPAQCEGVGQIGVLGPYLPLADLLGAASQIHQTGHSYVISRGANSRPKGCLIRYRRSFALSVLGALAVLFLATAWCWWSDLRNWDAELAAGTTPLLINQPSFWMIDMVAISILPLLGKTSKVMVHRSIFGTLILWGLGAPIIIYVAFLTKAEEQGYLVASRSKVLLFGEQVLYISRVRKTRMPDKIENPDASGPDGHPQIFTAFERMEIRKVQDLIAAGANLNARGNAQGTPLLIAAKGENWQTVEVLLHAGAEPLAADVTGFTVLWVAATSRIRPETKGGQALNRVRQILNDRGIIRIVLPPREVERLLAEGRWPPVPQ